MEFEERVVKTETIYDGAIMKVEKQMVKTPDGKDAVREIVRHSDAIAILAITAENKMILEKQWRAPVAKVTIEVPAGKLDYRDSNYVDAVVRELNEETRYAASQVQQLSSFYSAVGFCDEYMKIFLATDLKPVNNKLPRDKGEFIEILEVTLPEALQMVKTGAIEDAKTIMAIMHWQLMA